MEMWNYETEIIIIATVLIIVISFPFLAIQSEKAAEVRDRELKEIRKQEQYRDAVSCMEEGQYDKAITLFEELPRDYEDARNILKYAKYCQGVADEVGIEKLYRLTWDFPDENKYTGKYAEEMKNAEKEVKTQYEEYTVQKEKEEREEIKKDVPYKGMEEKYINSTILGRARDRKEEHYWRDTPGKRTQELQYRYTWYDSNGIRTYDAVCRNGRVSQVVKFLHTTSSNKKKSYTSTARDRSMDMYDVYDYDDPEDFYYDHIDEFDDIQDAEDYWEEVQ